MTERRAGFGAWGSGAQPFSAPRHSAREPLMIGGSRCLQPAVGSPSLARGSGLGSSPSRVLLPMLSSHAPTSPSPQDCSCALFPRSPRSWGTCSRDPAGPPEGGSHGAGRALSSTHIRSLPGMDSATAHCCHPTSPVPCTGCPGPQGPPPWRRGQQRPCPGLPVPLLLLALGPSPALTSCLLWETKPSRFPHLSSERVDQMS